MTRASSPPATADRRGGRLRPARGRQRGRRRGRRGARLVRGREPADRLRRRRLHDGPRAPAGDATLIDFFVAAPGLRRDRARRRAGPGRRPLRRRDDADVLRRRRPPAACRAPPAGWPRRCERFGSMPLADLVGAGVSASPARARRSTPSRPTSSRSSLRSTHAARRAPASSTRPAGRPLREGDGSSASRSWPRRWNASAPRGRSRSTAARSRRRSPSSSSSAAARSGPRDLAAYEAIEREPDPGPLPRHRGADQPAALLGRHPDRLLPRAARAARRAQRARAAGRGDGRRQRRPRRGRSPRRSTGRGSRRACSIRRARPRRRRPARLDHPHLGRSTATAMCASVTCSNGSGSGVLVPGTGVILNNMLGEEDLNPLGFHRIAPGRRVPSMMAPTVVLRDGEIELGLGSAGSNRIRSAILQTIVRVRRARDVERGRGGAGAAPALRAGRRPGRAGDRRGGAGADRGARHTGRCAGRGSTSSSAACRPSRPRRPPEGAATRAAAARRTPADALRGSECAVAMSAECASDASRSTSRPRGCSTGSRARRREARLALLERLAAEGVRWRSCARRSPPGGWRCCRSSGAGRRGPRYTAREIAEIVGSTSTAAARQRRRSASPTRPRRALAQRPRRPRGGAADARPSSTPACPRRGCCRWRGRSGWGRRGSPRRNRELVVRTLMQPGDTERDLALRFAARRRHCCRWSGRPSSTRAGAPARADPPRRDRRPPTSPRARSAAPPTLAVCFADLVEFTRLGEEIAARGAGPGRRPARGDGERGRPSRRCGW